MSAGTGDGYVKQAAFFFHLALAVAGGSVGEEVFFESGDEHGVELQSFGGVDGHEGDAGTGIFLGTVGVGEQGYLGQKVGQGDELIAGLLGLLVLKTFDGVEQFLNVFLARQALGGGVGVDVGTDAAFAYDFGGQGISVRLGKSLSEIGDQRDESFQFGCCAFRQFQTVSGWVGSYLEGGSVREERGLMEFVLGGGAYPAGGIVDDASEGFFVGEVRREPEICQDVFDLLSLVER